MLQEMERLPSSEVLTWPSLERLHHCLHETRAGDDERASFVHQYTLSSPTQPGEKGRNQHIKGVAPSSGSPTLPDQQLGTVLWIPVSLPSQGLLVLAPHSTAGGRGGR